MLVCCGGGRVYCVVGALVSMLPSGSLAGPWMHFAVCCGVLWWCWGLTVLCVLVSVLPSGSLGGPWLHFATSVGVAATEVNPLNNFVLLSCGVPVTPCLPLTLFVFLPQLSCVVLAGVNGECACVHSKVRVCGERWAGACSTLV